jgi:hypothetical protein
MGSILLASWIYRSTPKIAMPDGNKFNNNRYRVMKSYDGSSRKVYVMMVSNQNMNLTLDRGDVYSVHTKIYQTLNSLLSSMNF